VVVLIGAMAVAHYVFGMPVYDRNTGQLSTPGNTLGMFLVIGGGGALFVLLGTILYKWNPG
jgi:hypothetical protein